MKARISTLIPFLLTIFIIPVTMMITRKMEIGEIGRLASETQVITRWEYLLTQFNVVRTYMRLLFLPINQNLDYDFPISSTFFEGSTILSFLLIAFILFTGIRLFKRNRIISFGIIFFFLALSVESSIIPITDVIFEHRLYLPSIGFVMVVSVGLYAFSQYLCKDGSTRYATSRERYPVYLFLGLAFFVVAITSIATYERNKIWKDEFTLWKDVVEKSTRKARPHNNLGKAYDSLGRWQDAIEEYQITLRLETNNPDVHFNLGNVYANSNRYQEAIHEWNITLSIGPDHERAKKGLELVRQKIKSSRQ